MTKSLQNTKTKENLLKAFAGESMARMRYTFFSKAAKEENYVQISRIFEETARNEEQHAKRLLKFLGEEYETIKITNEYPIGLSEKTAENLEFAIAGEKEEGTILYPAFAKTAEEEGFNNISTAFSEIIKVEKIHEERFEALLEKVKEDTVFKSEKEIIWKCLKCGYHHFGKEPPARCPSCLHPKEYFEIYCRNY